MASAAVDAVLAGEGRTPPATIAQGYEDYLSSWRSANSAALKAGKRPCNVYVLHECDRLAWPDARKRQS
jgi:hypothetical protein